VQLSYRQLAIFAGSAVVGAVLWKYGGNPVAPAVVAAGYVANVFARGSALTSSSLTTGDLDDAGNAIDVDDAGNPIPSGIVIQAPADLVASAASVLGAPADSETYALARMGRSEGVDGMEYRMHIALNELAASSYGSVLALLTHSRIAAANGRFSQQRLGKWAATSRDPYEGDYALAAKVLQDHASGIDPSGGALRFVDKSAFATQPGVKKTYADVVAAWGAEGFSPVEDLPGASSDFVIFVRGAA
jgi:hypothetical protein